MAFADKYFTTVKSWDSDTLTATIQEDLFTGTSEEFKPVGGNPIVVEHQANVNIKESYIIPSKAKVSFYVNDEWDCHELLYSTDRQHKLIIKNGTVAIFTGWVVAGVHREDYTTGRYIIDITATDGLLDLKDIPYLDSGALYDVFKNPSVILSECLAETGHSLAFWENIDIFAASGMTTTVTTHSPLNQSYIHTKAYGDTINDVLSCYEVLESLLQAFYCRIYQTSELDGGNNNVWVISKIDRIGETATYREWNTAGTSIASNTSYNPSKSIGATYQHVGGRAQINVKQGYKEIIVNSERGHSRSLLFGGNFIDSDFPTSSTLTNWGTLSNLKFYSQWSTSTINKVIYGDDTMVELQNWASLSRSALGGDNSVDNGSGNVRITQTGHGLANGDPILIFDDDYEGIWFITLIDANNFDISATFTTNHKVRWVDIINHYGIEYDNPVAFDSGDIPVDADQVLKVDLEYFVEQHRAEDSWLAVHAAVIAYKSSTDYKSLDKNGNWIDYNANQIQNIFDSYDHDYNRDVEQKTGTIEIEAALTSSNNFYTTGSPKFYIALFSTHSTLGNDYLKWKSASVKMLWGNDKSVTTSVNTDLLDVLTVDFKHPDGDGLDNDEFRYLNPIRDDATPKLLINSWQQSGATADNLEDIFGANLETAYAENSQIWSGQIRGDIDITNAITIPLNLARQYQIQRISRNLVNNYNAVSLIEIEPSEAYYVELAADVGANYVYLSSAYGDISSDFTGSDTLRLSDLRNKSTGVVILSGSDTDIDGITFSGGRVRLELADLGFDVSPGASLEVKGVLRKI